MPKETVTTPEHDDLAVLRQEKCKCPACIEKAYLEILNAELKRNVFRERI